MGKLEDLKEQQEEALFALLMDEVARQNGAAYREENARLMADPNAAVPEAIDKACRKAIQRGFAERNRKKLSWSKVVQRLVAAILLIAALATITFAAVPEVRIWAMNLVIDTFDDHSEFNFSGSNTTSENMKLNPGWIPDGFVLTEQQASDLHSIYFYQNENGAIIYIEKFLIESPNQKVDLDTENATLEQITIQGKNATLASKDSKLWLLLPIPDSRHVILIKSEHVSPGTLIKIAENIPLFE